MAVITLEVLCQGGIPITTVTADDMETAKRMVAEAELYTGAACFLCCKGGCCAQQAGPQGGGLESLPVPYGAAADYIQ